MRTVDTYEFTLAASQNSTVKRLFTHLDEIHGIERTDNTDRCILLHGPAGTKYLVEMKYADAVKLVYGVDVAV